MQKFVMMGVEIMTFCKFHGTVAVETFFLMMNVFSAVSGDLFVTGRSTMAENYF